MTAYTKVTTPSTDYTKETQGSYLMTNDNVPIMTNDNRFLVILGTIYSKVLTFITNYTKI
jgi:hypothetical protein